jgi:hypothetical protein
MWNDKKIRIEKEVRGFLFFFPIYEIWVKLEGGF